MIPQLVTVRHRSRQGRGFRLYVPVLPVLLLLSPLLVLVVLAGVVACLVFHISPTGALRGVGRLLCALPGTRIEMDDGTMSLLISIR